MNRSRLILDDPEKLASALGSNDWYVTGGGITARSASGSLPHWLKLFVKGDPIGLTASDTLKVFLELVKGVVRTRIQSAELERYANTDALTGTFNRTYLEKELGEWIARSTSSSYFSLIYFDINSLKRVNDTYGHQAGDDLIRLSCILIKTIVRETDLVFRIGGDEFIILCPDTDCAQAEHLVDRIRKKEQEASVECVQEKTGIVVSEPISLSIGVACSLDVAPEHVLEAADQLMIRNKQAWYESTQNVRYR